MPHTVPEILNVGVLIPTEVQLLDLATVDMLAMLSQDYLTKAKLPQALVNLGVPRVNFYYVSDAPAGTHQACTGGVNVKITHCTTDPEVQLGKLDIILIPGPFLPAKVSDNVKKFIVDHHGNITKIHGRAEKPVTFLVVCTGTFVAAECGILDGRHVTGPRMMLPDLSAQYPGPKWNWSRR